MKKRDSDLKKYSETVVLEKGTNCLNLPIISSEKKIYRAAIYILLLFINGGSRFTGQAISNFKE